MSIGCRGGRGRPAEEHRQEPVALAGERPEQAGATPPRRARGRRRRVAITLQDDARPGVERVRDGASGWTHSRPCRARSSERKNGEAMPSGCDGRAHVVDEARQRQLGRAGAAADGPGRLVDAGPTVRPARARWPRRARSGPPPTTMASSRASRLTAGLQRRSAQPRRRRDPADGAVTCRRPCHGGAVPHVPRVSPLAPPVDAHLPRGRPSGSATPSDRARFLERPLPEPVVGPVGAEHVASAR